MLYHPVLSQYFNIIILMGTIWENIQQYLLDLHWENTSTGYNQLQGI